MKVLSICNQKGGVAKTTTALEIGQSMARKNYKVLYVDADPQGNLTWTLNANTEQETLYDALTDQARIEDTIQHIGNGDIIASSPMLSLLTDNQDTVKLRNVLLPLDYDVAIIDTPPSLSFLTLSALTASNGLIITALSAPYSLQGIGQLYLTLQAIREQNNPVLEVYGIVLCMYDKRTNVGRTFSKMLNSTAETLGTKLYKTHIRRCSAIVSAQSRKESIFKYAPRSHGAEDYNSLTNEVLEDLNK